MDDACQWEGKDVLSAGLKSKKLVAEAMVA
jgi:hypothetical protein